MRFACADDLAEARAEMAALDTERQRATKEREEADRKLALQREELEGAAGALASEREDLARSAALVAEREGQVSGRRAENERGWAELLRSRAELREAAEAERADLERASREQR
jgi:hypothetical protein